MTLSLKDIFITLLALMSFQAFGISSKSLPSALTGGGSSSILVNEPILMSYKSRPTSIGSTSIKLYFPAGFIPLLAARTKIFLKTGPIPTGCGHPLQCYQQFLANEFPVISNPYVFQITQSMLDADLEVSFFVYSESTTGDSALSDFGNIRFSRPVNKLVSDCGSFNPTMKVVPTSLNTGYVTNATGTPLYGNLTNPQPYPLIWALKNTGPAYGYHVLLAPGNYAGVEFDQDWSYDSRLPYTGATSQNRVILKGSLDQQGRKLSTFEGQAGRHTFEIKADNNNHKFSYISFCDFKIEAGESAFHIGSAQGNMSDIVFESLYFDGLEVIGGFNHVTQEDQIPALNSKWGFQVYASSDLRILNSTIKNLKREHAAYFHNMRGDVTIYRNFIRHVGRTAFQIVNRKDEDGFAPQPLNFGTIVIRENYIEDTGIAVGDGCKGGQAITVTARNMGELWILGNEVRQGLNPTLKSALRNIPDCANYDLAGAVVTWSAPNDGLGPNEFFGSIGPTRVFQNRILYPPGEGQSTSMHLNSSILMHVAQNEIQTAEGLFRGIVLGSDQTHPIPVSYCVKSNLIDGIMNNLIKLGSQLVSQPQSINMDCN